MSSLVVVHGVFCGEDPIIQGLSDRLALERVAPHDVVELAVRTSSMTGERIRRALTARTSVFNPFTREKERALAHVKLAVAEKLLDGDRLFIGAPGLLIPGEMSGVLRICLISGLETRVRNAVARGDCTEEEAKQRIDMQENDLAALMRRTRQGGELGNPIEDLLNPAHDPWNPDRYDIVVPVDEMSTEDAVSLIEQKFRESSGRSVEDSSGERRDFLLAVRVEAALAREGHILGVKAEGGAATIALHGRVPDRDPLEEEFERIAGGVEGVRSVRIELCESSGRDEIYRKVDFRTPSKVLLVDDEKEFIRTLSERLQMREMGSAVVYNGQSALDLIENDAPDVMVLDLKMPGIDGVEVLRRVKSTHPGIQVIMLTGHGSDDDKKVCMDLGAFAYLNKPIDINILTDTLMKAYEKAGGAE